MPPEPDHDFDLQRIPPLSQVGDDQINIPFDRYLLLRQVGEGAMGTVYEAKQNEPARTVAVKIMKSKHASAAAESRFLRETRLLATLNHPHVAQLYDAGVHHHGVLKVPFCVMELVRGASSITVFAKSSGFDIKATIELFLQVCAAVRHAHEQGVIHCDLKPSNILVNGDGRVKVIDFGVARSMQLDESGGGTVWSDASVIFGTPQYMSPEQVSGHDFELDQRSDVYALGVILYELLCGHLPYKVDRTSSVTAAKSILESDPTAPRKYNRSLRGDIEKILDKALVKDADGRYQTVRALEDDLHRLLSGEPVSPDRRRIYRARRKGERWIARHRLFAAAVAVLSTSVLCAILGGWSTHLGLDFAYDLFLTQRIGHVPSAPLAHVAIVRLRESADIPAIAGTRQGDGPDDTTHPRFARRAHGQLLKRLAQAGVRPRAVAFDITFGPYSTWDKDFAEGIRSIGAVPVIVVAQGGTDQSPLEPIVAPALRPLVWLGGTNALMRRDSPWMADLATTLPNGGIHPSLALMTASQCWHPGEIPAMEWTFDAVRLHYADGTTREVDVTSISEMPDENPAQGLRKGTPFAEFMIEVPRDPHLDQSSLDYQDVFAKPDAELQARLDGKVLLIGDYRTGADGPFPHPDGRSMPGATLQAVTIERLLSGDALKRPRFITGLGAYVTSAAPMVLGSAILGAGVAFWLTGRPLARGMTYLLLAIVIVSAALMSFRLAGFIYLPVAPLLCVVVGGELINRICRARESTI